MVSTKIYVKEGILHVNMDIYPIKSHVNMVLL